MNTIQINEALRSFPNFCGVFPRDQLPRKTRRPAGLVINTDRASEPGTHWVAYFIAADGRAEYFDPLGDPMPNNEIMAFIRRNNGDSWQQTVSNVIPFQSPTSERCGEFCIFYLEKRLAGRSMCEIHAILSQASEVNDAIVRRDSGTNRRHGQNRLY